MLRCTLPRPMVRADMPCTIPDMHRMALERLQLEEDLRNALEGMNSKLYYQPFVGLASRKVYGAEALIRWRHEPEVGLISPAQFIPVAEETASSFHSATG